MKTVRMFEKGEHVFIEMEIANVRLAGSTHEYELKDAVTGEFLDNKYHEERLITREEMKKGECKCEKKEQSSRSHRSTTAS